MKKEQQETPSLGAAVEINILCNGQEFELCSDFVFPTFSFLSIPLLAL